MHHAPTRAMPAVFLDRDGTLIHDRGYLTDPAEAVLFDETVPALRLLQERFALFIVTNQGGVARGLHSLEAANRVTQAVVDRLGRQGVRIRTAYTCPHQRSDGCECIKPNPFFPLQAAADFGITPECSFAVGDHPHDIALAHRFGGRGIYVLTGHGTRHRGELAADTPVAADLREAAGMILREAPPVPAAYITAAAAGRILRDGGTAAIPTETVYGLAANALDEKAVQRVFDLKRRPSLDPLIVHLAGADELTAVAAGIPDAARALAGAFWPGPLTLVLPKQPRIPARGTAGLPTVAVRVPAHPLARGILREAGCPLAAPSANRFGAISPTRARHVLDTFGDTLDGIVDGGPCAVGVESTIIGFWDDRAWLLRPGGIGLERIEAVIGPVEIYRKRDAADIRAPGTMPRHYAPSTPLRLADPSSRPAADGHGRIGRLVFGPDAPGDAGAALTENLSPGGDLAEAAAALYAALRRLDAAGLDMIVADRLPDTGLGRTLNDRLRRAAAGQEPPEMTATTAGSW